jgi:SNF2 family DNA or RNA helicase
LGPDTNVDDRKLVDQTSKYDILRKIVSESKGGVLVFATTSVQFTEIAEILKTDGVTYNQIEGKTTTRQRTIDDYNSGKTKVLLLNARKNGAGLNLQARTHDIILCHLFDSGTRKQAIGRAARPGLDHPLKVHCMYCKDEELDFN